MIEVEIKAKVDDFNEIKKKLKSLKAKPLKPEHQIDKIFGHPKFLDSNKMIIEGGIVPRIRSVDDKCLLEFKEIRRGKGGLELKSVLGDMDMGVKFLEKLGFNEAFTIKKHRQSYKYKNFEIELDDIEKLGKFVEIERIVLKEDEKESARKACLDLLKKIAPDAAITNKKNGDMMQELINKKGK